MESLGTENVAQATSREVVTPEVFGIAHQHCEDGIFWDQGLMSWIRPRTSHLCGPAMTKCTYEEIRS